MNLRTHITNILIKNKYFIIVLLFLAMLSAVLHHRYQDITHKTSFIVSDGKIKSDYSSIFLSFIEIDTTHFDLTQDEIIIYKNLLSDVTVNVNPISDLHISVSIISKEDKTPFINQYQDAIITLMNHQKNIKELKKNSMQSEINQLKFITNQLVNYSKLMETYSADELSSKYLELENRVYELETEKIILEEEINRFGDFFKIVPIKPFNESRKPVILFLFLYLFLAGVIFILFSKKK